MAVQLKIFRQVNNNTALIDDPTVSSITGFASQVEVDAGTVVRAVSCDSSVNSGEPVRFNSDGKAFQALATNYSNVNFIGICVLKETQTMCSIRIAGKTSAIYSTLVRNDDYFVGVTGNLVNTIPGSGNFTLRAGTAYDSQSLVIYKGIATKRS